MHATEGQPRTQRPSLLIELLTGDLGSRTHMNRTPAETPVSHPAVSQSIPPHSTLQTGHPSSAIKMSAPTQIYTPSNGTQIARGTYSLSDNDSRIYYRSVSCRYFTFTIIDTRIYFEYQHRIVDVARGK